MHSSASDRRYIDYEIRAEIQDQLLAELAEQEQEDPGNWTAGSAPLDVPDDSIPDAREDETERETRDRILREERERRRKVLAERVARGWEAPRSRGAEGVQQSCEIKVDPATEELIRKRVDAALGRSLKEAILSAPDGDPQEWMVGTIFACAGNEILDGTGLDRTPQVQALLDRIEREENEKMWNWVCQRYGHIIEKHNRELRSAHVGCLSAVLGTILCLVLVVCLLA